MKSTFRSFTVVAASVCLLSGCSDSSKPTAGASAENKPAAPAPFTGQVHEVKMRGTPQGFFFEPKELTVKQGDKVKWSIVDGGPHNVNFSNPAFADKTKVPDGAKVKLESQGKLVGPLLQIPGQTEEIVFGKDLPTGEYNYICDPHAPLGMIGKITVAP